MSLFPSLYNDNDKSFDDLNQLQQGSLFHSIEYELSDIVKKIKNIENLNESEIKKIIIRQHSMILNYDLFLMSNETRQDAQTLFVYLRTKRFVLISLLMITILILMDVIQEFAIYYIN